MDRQVQGFQMHPMVGLAWSCWRLAALGRSGTPLSRAAEPFKSFIPRSTVPQHPDGGRRWKR